MHELQVGYRYTVSVISCVLLAALILGRGFDQRSNWMPKHLDTSSATSSFVTAMSANFYWLTTPTIIIPSLPCFTCRVSVLSLLITCSYFTTIPTITVLNIRSGITHICLTPCIIHREPYWQLPLVHTHGMCVDRIALKWPSHVIALD